MALPKILKDFLLFGDGNSYQGEIPELTLPELSRKMEEYRAGGMQGPIQIDLGAEKIEFKWKAAGLVDSAFLHLGAATHHAAQLRFTGSYEDDETGTGIAVEIVMRGRHTQVNMGDAKPGSNNTMEITTAVSYYKLTVAGTTKWEIDMANNVFIVNGTDRLADRRQRLGM